MIIRHKKLDIIGGIVLAVMAVELVLYFFTGAFGRTAIHTLRNRDRSADGIHTAYYLSQRGRILDSKGSVIAADKTIWDVHLDCTVLDVPESEWESLSRELSLRLEEILGDKKAWEYYDVLKTGRAGHKRYLKICEEVEDSVAEALRKAPILNKDQFEGGRIFTSRQIRSYPFGSLGRQTIGHPHPEYPTGIEGAYNAVLCGDTGKVEYVLKLRNGKYVRKDISRNECFEEMRNIAVGNTYEPGGVLTQFPSEVLEKGLCVPLRMMGAYVSFVPPVCFKDIRGDSQRRGDVRFVSCDSFDIKHPVFTRRGGFQRPDNA